jgi:hypothetical protein
MRAIYRGTSVLLFATAMVASAALLPMTQVANSAFAAGGGGGGGGGEGRGGGDGGGKGSGEGSGKGSADAGDTGASNGKGSTASSLGALNAASASPTAMAHAAPTSRVGEIAAYKAAVGQLALDIANKAPAATITADQTAAAQALAAAANKGITAGAVSALDAKLGVTLDSATTAALAAQAASLQTKH